MGLAATRCKAPRLTRTTYSVLGLCMEEEEEEEEEGKEGWHESTEEYLPVWLAVSQNIKPHFDFGVHEVLNRLHDPPKPADCMHRCKYSPTSRFFAFGGTRESTSRRGEKSTNTGNMKRMKRM